MPAPARTRPKQPQAFIAWESRRKGRYELVGGEIRMMAGGSRAHDLIAGNLLVALRAALAGRGCDVHGSNLKLASPVGMVTYPDLFVRCGPLDDEALACDDAVVVVEVLSPSMCSEDLVRKRWGYQAIPSLRHLVYVDPSAPMIEVASRADDGRWWSVFLSGLDAALELPAIDARLPLTAIYAGTRAAAG